MVVGPGKALDPQKIAAVFVSPRTRARQTFELMFDDTTRATLADKTEVTEDIREWDYGRYEGKLKKDIVADRAARGVDVDRAWDIWLDGCEDGESPAQISERLDRLIAKIKQIQGPYMNCEKDVDVVIVAHGHSLRAFTKRWLELDLAKKLPLLLEPGALGVLSYEHHNVNEPALSLGVNLGSH